jgi:hypothetical protein
VSFARLCIAQLIVTAFCCRTSNLNVVITLNAHERSIKDWTSVVALASDRLRISRIVNPPGSYFSEIEVVLNP